MLYVTPVSWIKRYCYYLGSTPQFVLAWIDEEMSPYAIGNPVTESEKNYLGNRDCVHRNVHGTVIYNDSHYPTYTVPIDECWYEWEVYADTRRYISLPWDCDDPDDRCDTNFIAHQKSNDFMCWWAPYESHVEPLIVRLGHIGNLIYAIHGQLATYSGSWRFYMKWRLELDVQAAWYDPETDWFYEPDLPPWTFTVDLPCGQRSMSIDYYESYNWMISSGDIYRDDYEQYDNQKDWKLNAMKSFISQVEDYLSHSKVGDAMRSRSVSDSIPIETNRLKSSQICSLKNRIFEIGRLCEPQLSKEPYVLYGEASQAAAEAARSFDGNTAALAKELVQLKGSIEDLIGLLRGKADIKSLSNLYLTGKYGLRLTAQDTAELTKAIIKTVSQSENGLYSMARGMSADGETVVRCVLYYDSSTNDLFSKVMEAAMSWDLFPSMQNVWDIIPYSFVVDWFVDVEGFLIAIDANTYMSTMNIFSSLYSLKKEWERTPSMNDNSLIGPITYTLYKRWTENEPYPPIPTFSGKDPSNHIIDGSALIIQRL